MAKRMMLKRTLSLCLIVVMLFQFTACGFFNSVKSTASTVVDAAGDIAKDAASTVAGVASEVKDNVVSWCSSVDLSAFRDGWDAAIGFVGTAYATAMSSAYIANVEQAISNLKTDINAAYGSARTVASEAGFAAEKWIADTFNIDAALHESSYHAEVVGSNELGSIDVSTNYGENASLKYYQSAKGSANAQAAITDQAKGIIQRYAEYCDAEKKIGNNNPLSLKEFMDETGYEPSSEDALLESMYAGQTRIIPVEQMEEAVEYLKGRINKLSGVDGDIAAENVKRYQETLENLKDRLTAPDGTESKPLTRDQAQAIAELSQRGEFNPEDFGINLSQIIEPKYVLKQAVGTGIETGVLKTIFTVGPDIVSIIAEGVKSGNIDENALAETGVEGAVAMGEGFVEGSVSRIIVTLCESGALGEALKGVSENVIGSLVFLTIEAMISGYTLAKGEITAEEYGCLMADRILITALALPTTALMLTILPGTKLFMLIGCLAGGILASTGYSVGKEAVLEFVDGGGFEAIVPEGVASSLSTIKEKIASINFQDEPSNLQEFAVTTVNTGVIIIKNLFT